MMNTTKFVTDGSVCVCVRCVWCVKNVGGVLSVGSCAVVWCRVAASVQCRVCVFS